MSTQISDNRQPLVRAAVEILNTANCADKVKLTAAAYNLWFEKYPVLPFTQTSTSPPIRPARPDRPELLPPKQVPRRRINSAPNGRIALIHAIAHIELNAIDLAWDIIARFSDQMPDEFISDWCQVAWDEGLHFSLLTYRLNQLGATYGDLPAHDGLWSASQKTSHDILARLAVVPMVLEARGLDVTPQMITKLENVGDLETAAILSRIHDDEINHVASGKKWFDFLVKNINEEPHIIWQKTVTENFLGGIKPPFNIDSRNKAKLPYDWYGHLAYDNKVTKKSNRQ